jgi:hypothetical protein
MIINSALSPKLQIACASAVAVHILKRKSHGGTEFCRENPPTYCIWTKGICRFSCKVTLKHRAPSRQELIFSNPTNNSHGSLGVQFRKKRMKLKMFLMLLAISVGHRKIDHFNISDHLEAPLTGMSSSAVTQLATATALWVFSLEKNL